MNILYTTVTFSAQMSRNCVMSQKRKKYTMKKNLVRGIAIERTDVKDDFFCAAMAQTKGAAVTIAGPLHRLQR